MEKKSFEERKGHAYTVYEMEKNKTEKSVSLVGGAMNDKSYVIEFCVCMVTAWQLSDNSMTIFWALAEETRKLMAYETAHSCV